MNRISVQLEVLKAAGSDVVRSKKVCGTSVSGRTELWNLLDFARQGDTIVVRVLEATAIARQIGIDRTSVYRVFKGEETAVGQILKTAGLALCLSFVGTGFGWTQDFEKGLAASQRGDYAQNFQKGFEASQRGDYATALREWRPLAEQGTAEAQFNLGVMYRDGLGVTQDYNEAVKWYRKSAEQGNALAQYSLGVMYDKGQGVTQDYKAAVKWYRKSAEQGFASGPAASGPY